MRSESSSIATPIQSRLKALDAIRGFALFGIYLSIIHSFNSSMIYGQGPGTKPDSLEQLIGLFQNTFINLRFIGMFSLLFGIGIAIQEKNFQQRQAAFRPYFIRRMSLLACFGLINITFLFHTEILLVYAVFGLLAWGLSRLNLKLAIAIAISSLAIWGSFFEIVFRDNLLESFAWFTKEVPFTQLKEIYTSGSLWEKACMHWIEYRMIYADNGFHLGSSLAMIIFGYAIGKKDLHLRFLENIGKLKSVFFISILITLGFGAYAIIFQQTFFALFHTPLSFFPFLTFQIASMFSYIYVISYLQTKSQGRNLILKALANNGRLSLTGYMGGALAYSFIFYGHGLGLYTEVDGVTLNLIALGAYLSFTLLGSLWLTKFRRGPLEWLLRRFSYGKL